MKMVQWISCMFLLVCMAVPLRANNIAVTTPRIVSVNTADDFAMIAFDLSWDHSFRDDINWDAAWVFVKFQVSSGDWAHASLNTTASNHTLPSGFTGSVGDTDGKGMGIFVYRDSNGSGSVSLSDVQLRWEYGDDGMADDATFTLKVFAIEMIYVPTGAFSLGSGGDDGWHFYEHDGTGTPDENVTYTVSSEDALTIGTSAGNLWGALTEGYRRIGDAGTLSASFPKGYGAFYCMKYEISQGQYADFLNTLTETQDISRYQSGYYDTHRFTISGTAGSHTVDVPDRACNYVTWMDGCAYADWAGLRPISEMEFEKACRGTAAPVAEEFAWGSANRAEFVYTFSNDGLPNETVSNAASDPIGNFFYSVTNDTSSSGPALMGPLRCGIFAATATTRAEAGATYYGIMEMCGNLWERIVVIENDTGRAFAGTHGDGVLSENGNATNSDWPGYASGEVTGAYGAGFKGGSFSEYTLISEHRVSDRRYCGGEYTSRNYTDGMRLVRSVE